MALHDLIPEVLQVDGKTESLYVYFRKGVKIKESLRIFSKGLGRIIVNVGFDENPVAMQVVDFPAVSQAVAAQNQELDMDYEEAKRVLHSLAKAMIALVEVGRRDLGEQLISDALEAAKHLKPELGLHEGSACGA